MFFIRKAQNKYNKRIIYIFMLPEGTPERIAGRDHVTSGVRDIMSLPRYPFSSKDIPARKPEPRDEV